MPEFEVSLTLAYALIAVGFLLMLAELFIPSGGVLSVLSIASLGIGVYFVFINNNTLGMWTLFGVFIALPLLGSFMMRLWPKTPIGKRLTLQAPDDNSRAMMAAHEELEDLRGKVGRVISVMRPSGMVDFDGRRIDCISEGMMIQPDEHVRCVDVRAGKVLVRPVEKPNLDNLETVEFDS